MHRSKYFDAIKTINNALTMISCSYPEYQLKLNSMHSIYNQQNHYDIIYAAQHPCPNPFSDIFIDLNIPQRIKEMTPVLIGVSITFESQLISAFILVNLLRENGIKTQIVMGGALFSTFARLVSFESPFFNLIDGIIIGPGEIVLEMLYHGNIEASDFKYSQQAPNKFRSNDMEKLPVPLPDFTSLPLSQYLSPYPVLPFRLREKCYWGRCAFCNGDNNSACNRTLTPSDAVEQLKLLKKINNVDRFYLLDSTLSLDEMIAFSKTLIDKNADIMWAENSRFETRLAEIDVCKYLYKAGCRMLKFGLESASINVLKKMRKGIDIKIAGDVIRACHNAGIINHVYVMFGFPGENDKDRQLTVSFIEELADKIDILLPRNICVVRENVTIA
ncbi:MAG: radical SAM protein, partial [bacterium]|nr:radical SAM protein [bacterium]